MITNGFFANIICIVVINVMIATWGNFYFNLSDEDYKIWANETMICE